MAQENIPPEPLNADPGRQATGLFKGLDYQIWLSVLAWSDLKEEELLQIEGAEDFDIVTAETGLSVQVKALANPISLRSQSVCDAIRNFWQNKHANNQRILKFRFVTTAQATLEKGEPFGKGVAGLDFWNIAANALNPNNAERIRSFLLEDSSVKQRLAAPLSATTPSLAQFLTEATPKQLLDQLFIPLSWDLRADGVEGAREAVRIRLHAYGERKGLSIQDCDKAMAPLFEHVANKAFQEKRLLSREDFRVVFDEATRETIPKTELALLRHLARQPVPGTALNQFETTRWDIPIERSVPALPSPCCPRTSLANTLTAALLKSRFLALSGSTGSGKSTMAKLIALRSGGKWLWVDCRGATDPLMVLRFREIARIFSENGEPFSVVFDGLDFGGTDAPNMLRSLAGALLLITKMRGAVMVTSQRALPNLFRREVPFPQDVFFTLPALTDEEVGEFCAMAGCSDIEQLKRWRGLIWLQTQGHPQLVHARIAFAARRGWPAVDARELLTTPEDIKEECSLFRQLLLDLDDGQRELLYRLSLASRPFRRDHAIAAGEIEPAIQHCGDRFDALVGPWIETSGADYFHLSPLLTGAGEANWSASRLGDMRASYGRAVMHCGNATLAEASEVLFQAVTIQDDKLAAPVIAQLMLVPHKRLPFVASELDWLLYFTRGTPLFANNSFISLSFRLIQFRLATAGEHPLAMKIGQLLDAESQKAIDPEIGLFFRQGTVLEILLAFKIPFPAAMLLRCWLDADRLASTTPGLSEISEGVAGKRWKKLGFANARSSDILFGFILARRGGLPFLRDFVAAVDSLAITEQENVLSALRANWPRLQMFLDDLWNAESRKLIPSWDEVLDGLNLAKAAGVRWKLPDMVISAARGIAVIQDEYLSQSDVALETLRRASEEAGTEGLMLRYQRGTIFFRRKDFERAYDTWASTLDQWPVGDFDSNLQALFAHSGCGTAAGHLNRWSEAAHAFQRGREIAQKSRLKVEAIAFGADAAYAFWRKGDKGRAITGFATSLDEMGAMAGRKEPSGFHTLWKLLEQIIRWCAQDVGAPQATPIPAPRPGTCSEPREREQHDALQKYPRSPLMFDWYSLAEAELYGTQGTRLAFDKVAHHPEAQKYPWLQSLVGFLKLRQAFKEGDFENLVLLIEETAQATALAKANPTDFASLIVPVESPAHIGDYTSEVVTLGPQVLLSALIALVALGKDPRETIKKWLRAASTAKSNFDYLHLLDEATQLVTMDVRSASIVYKDPNSNRFHRLASALRMGSDPESSLGACFVGLISLVNDDWLASGRLGLELYLGALVKQIWEQRINFSAEFRSPNLTIPPIRTACNSQFHGLKLAAHILLAAANAVSVSLLQDAIPRLRRLAENEQS